MAHGDKVEHPSSNTVEDLLPEFNNERVNIDEVENSTRSLISTCLQWRMGWGEGRAFPGFPWRRHFSQYSESHHSAPQVSKEDQSHFEAAGAAFVCEGCEVLSK